MEILKEASLMQGGHDIEYLSFEGEIFLEMFDPQSLFFTEHVDSF